MSGTPLKEGGCKDLDVKVNGMKCWQIAREGYCDASTSIGSVGFDLCPESCGNCPPKPAETTGSPVKDPAVIETVGESRAADDGDDSKESDKDEKKGKSDDSDDDADDTADTGAGEEEPGGTNETTSTTQTP